MQKTTLGLVAALGAVAASPALANAPATTADSILRPTSVAELLDPIANPLEVMKDLQARSDTLAPVEVSDADISVGTSGVTIAHHHHHHHYRRRLYIYHHHHHHHYIYHHHHHHFLRYHRYHHHHHHHHHHHLY
jgi:hypothetical protein